MTPKQVVAILVTSRGSSLDPLMACINQNPYYTIGVIITHDQHAPIVERAKNWGIPCVVIDKKGKAKKVIDQAITHCLEQYHVSLVLLMGYMRVLSADFVNRWPTLNLHPSLLPKHKGLMDLGVHQAVLDHQESESGISCHWVTEQVDEGPVMMQLTFEVLPEDTALTLKAKAQALEGQALIKLFNKPNLIEQWKSLS